jgi:hypothetical protein
VAAAESVHAINHLRVMGVISNTTDNLDRARWYIEAVREYSYSYPKEGLQISVSGIWTKTTGYIRI